MAVLIKLLMNGLHEMTSHHIYSPTEHLPANLTLIRSSGCRTSVASVPPATPLTKCSYLIPDRKCEGEKRERAFLLPLAMKEELSPRCMATLCPSR